MIYLDKGVYSKKVILKTAYRFADQVYLHITQDDRFWLISWVPMEGKENLSDHAFENEAINQQLRYELLNENQELRKIILARAYASTVIDSGPGQMGETKANAEPQSFIQEQPDAATLFSIDNQELMNGWFDTHEGSDV